MRKLKVSNDLTYRIRLDWNNDYILADCIERQIAYLIKECRSFKKCGCDFSFYLKDIKVLRSILHQIYLHKDL